MTTSDNETKFTKLTKCIDSIKLARETWNIFYNNAILESKND